MNKSDKEYIVSASLSNLLDSFIFLLRLHNVSVSLCIQLYLTIFLSLSIIYNRYFFPGSAVIIFLLLQPLKRNSTVRLARSGHRVFIPATGVRIPYGTPFNLCSLTVSKLHLNNKNGFSTFSNSGTWCDRK